MTTDNLYYAWANNKAGAILDVNSGGKTSSIRKLENAARSELGSKWTVHIMQVHFANSDTEIGNVSEVKTFTIR